MNESTQDQSAPATSRYAELKTAWLALVTAFMGVAMGIAALTAHTSGALFLPIIHEFGWTRAQLSLGHTSYGVLSMGSLPFVGALVDRFGVRRVAGVSILGCVVMLFLFSRFQGDLSHFILMMAILGLIGAGNSAVVYVALVTSWFDRMRGLAIGIAMAGSGVSAIIAPKFMIPYIAEAGWRMGYQALAIAMLVTLPLVLFGAKNKEDGPVTGHGPAPSMEGLTLREALRTARFWRLALVMALTGMGLSGFYSHFVPMITDRGFSAADAANAAALFGAAVLTGRLLSGYLIDRLYPPIVATGAWSLGVVCLGILLLPGTLQVYLAGAAIGVAFGTEFDFAGYVTARIFGRRAYGKLFGLLFAIFGVGGLGSPIIYGYVHDQSGSYAYAIALSMVALMAAIPVVWWLGAHPEPRKS